MSKIVNAQSGFFFIGAEMTNPNGDPTDNSPRMLPDGHGYMSSQCIKRKMRDMIQYHDGIDWESIKKDNPYIKDENYWISESNNRGYDTNDRNKSFDLLKKDHEGKSEENFFNKYWDARSFGVVLEDTKSKFKVTGRGAIQMDKPTTVHEVELVVNGNATKQRNVTVVRCGLYVGFYRVNVMKSCCTQEDVELFKYLLPKCFRNSNSNSRSLKFMGGFHLTHNGIWGSFNDFEVKHVLTPTLKDGIQTPKSVYDYNYPDISALKNIDGIGKIEILK